MDMHEIPLLPNHQAFIERFVKACQADDRIVAAFLGGSNAKGYADAYSDVDVCVITTDQAFENFVSERESFLRSLGDLVFLEDFEIPNIAFYIFADDTEGELNFGREGRLSDIHAGQFHILVDKKNLLEGAIFSEDEPTHSEQVEKLRRQVQWFWHELSHFITAMQRNRLWWAQGQLEALRSICVNLVRLRHNILDAEAGEEAYFKLEYVMPVEPLSALKETFGPLEKEGLLQAVLAIVRFYLDIAPLLAQKHGVHYSHDLERVMMHRLQKLRDTNSPAKRKQQEGNVE
jgi:predicted nucleotidyltransferase